MSIDSLTGNLYVADSGSRVIRMINKTTGIITTIAGGGYSYHRGDGGLAVLATLFSPYDVATDPLNGNIYIADGSTIRMVTKSTGIITTIAGNSTRSGYTGDGGLARLATLSSPQGIDVDPRTGDLYIADTYNYAVRMIKRSTGIISTIAGTGKYGYAGDGGPATSAMLSFPYSVVLDASSSMMYIADQDNYVVRNFVWTPTTAVNSPSIAPTGYSPSIAPTGYSPSIAPTGYSPSIAPTGYSPSIAPTGYSPSIAPTKYSPSMAPTETFSASDSVPSKRIIAIIAGTISGFLVLLALAAIVYCLYGKPLKKKMSTSTVPSSMIENENEDGSVDPRNVSEVAGRDKF